MSATILRESSKNTLQNLLAKNKTGLVPTYQSYCIFEGESRIRWVASVTIGTKTYKSTIYTNRKVEAEESAANAAICDIIRDETLSNIQIGNGRLNRRNIDAKLGYVFKSIYLLKVVFYHKSLGPMVSEYADQDSKLAYLGDGILKWVLCDYNFSSGITAAENSIMSSQCASRKYCAEMFRNLDLENELQVSLELVGMRERQGLGIALLGEKFETLIGAIFIDSKKSPEVVKMILERAGYFKFGRGSTNLPKDEDFQKPLTGDFNSYDSTEKPSVINVMIEAGKFDELTNEEKKTCLYNALAFKPYSEQDEQFMTTKPKSTIPPPYSYKARAKPKTNHLTLLPRSDAKSEDLSSEDELNKIQEYLKEKKVICRDDVINHSNCSGNLNKVEETTDD